MRSLYVFLLLQGLLQALEWQHDYEMAKKLAVREEKLLYVFVVSETCRWCRKMEATTMQDASIQGRLHAKYIPLTLMRGVDEYPESLQAELVPKHFFFTPEGKRIYEVPGYYDTEEFHAILQSVEERHLKRLKEK